MNQGSCNQRSPEEFGALHTCTFHSCLWQGGTQPLSYCCQHPRSATELALRKAIFPFFLACIYVVSSPTALTHRCTSLNFPLFSHTVIPPPSPSSSGTGEHSLYLQPVTCLLDPHPTQTFLLLCPALVHLSALPPLPLTPGFCFFWGCFHAQPGILGDLCLLQGARHLHLRNLCCQLNSSPTDLLLEQPKVEMLLGRVGGQPTPPAPCTSDHSHQENPDTQSRTALLRAGNLTLQPHRSCVQQLIQGSASPRFLQPGEEDSRLHTNAGIALQTLAQGSPCPVPA